MINGQTLVIVDDTTSNHVERFRVGRRKRAGKTLYRFRGRIVNRTMEWVQIGPRLSGVGRKEGCKGRDAGTVSALFSRLDCGRPVTSQSVTSIYEVKREGRGISD